MSQAPLFPVGKPPNVVASDDPLEPAHSIAPFDRVVDAWLKAADARRKAGHPVGKPRRRPTEQREPQLVATLKAFDAEECILVIDWAFHADDWHAARLRGDAGDGGRAYLAIANLFRSTKFAVKLAAAEQWVAQGRKRLESGEVSEEETAAGWLLACKVADGSGVPPSFAAEHPVVAAAVRAIGGWGVLGRRTADREASLRAAFALAMRATPAERDSGSDTDTDTDADYDSEDPAPLRMVRR